jgi:beta-phosphoglucomutase-like phosphatase (HAD superfamily)
MSSDHTIPDNVSVSSSTSSVLRRRASKAAPLKEGDRIAKPRIGQRVKIVAGEFKGETGTVRFFGNVEFASGEWAGVELDNKVGKNDGSMKGQQYFVCDPRHGLFLKTSLLRVGPRRRGSATSGNRKPKATSGSSPERKTRKSRTAAAAPSASSGSPKPRRPTKRTPPVVAAAAAPGPGPAAASTPDHEASPGPGLASNSVNSPPPQSGIPKLDLASVGGPKKPTRKLRPSASQQAGHQHENKSRRRTNSTVSARRTSATPRGVPTGSESRAHQRRTRLLSGRREATTRAQGKKGFRARSARPSRRPKYSSQSLGGSPRNNGLNTARRRMLYGKRANLANRRRSSRRRKTNQNQLPKLKKLPSRPSEESLTASDVPSETNPAAEAALANARRLHSAADSSFNVDDIKVDNNDDSYDHEQFAAAATTSLGGAQARMLLKKVQRDTSRSNFGNVKRAKTEVNLAMLDAYDSDDDNDLMNLAELNSAANTGYVPDSIRVQALATSRARDKNLRLGDDVDFEDQVDAFLEDLLGDSKSDSKLPPNMELAVFDLMGVLADEMISVGSDKIQVEALAFVAALKAYGLHIFPDDYYKHAGKTLSATCRALLLEHGGGHGLSDTDFHDEVRLVYASLNKHIPRYCLEVTSTIPGAKTVLEVLKQHNIRTAVVSTLPRALVLDILDRLGLNSPQLIDAVVTDEEVTRSRPESGMIIKAMKDTGVWDSSKVIKISSTKMGISEGNHAEAWNAVVKKSVQKTSVLSRSRPNFMLRNVRELLNIFPGIDAAEAAAAAATATTNDTADA